jgi:integrase
MSGQVCILEDGRRVRFSLKKRERDPFYYVAFQGPDGRRLERSTKEPNQRRAADSATSIIKDEFATKVVVNNHSWEEAKKIMVQHMEARNLRPATIDDYKFTVNTLQKVFPKTNGPADITTTMAERYKIERLALGKSVWTVKGNLNALNVVFGQWLQRVCKIVTANPFVDVEPPKVEKSPPRIIAPEEVKAFFDWLSQRWVGWRLPILFLEVKGLVGCRITELASASTGGLQDGRIRFDAETTKGRKQRNVKLPPHIYHELQTLAGKHYVFEKFASQLRRAHIKRGNPHHAVCVGDFSPGQLRGWLQGEKELYIQRNPSAKNFKLHNFRGTAMSKARMVGVGFDDAAVAFGCHPETMRKHYVALDETEISDRVMDKLQGRSAEKSGGKSGGMNRADAMNNDNGSELDEKSGVN